MDKPTLITQIEEMLGRSLQPAPTRGHDPALNAMACRRDPEREDGWLLQYALHPDGALAGLNLAGLGIHSEDWLNLS